MPAFRVVWRSGREEGLIGAGLGYAFKVRVSNDRLGISGRGFQVSLRVRPSIHYPAATVLSIHIVLHTVQTFRCSP
jgi:hypothetical protein